MIIPEIMRNKKVYNAIDVARHIINYCSDNDIYVDHIRLTKFLYFCQASFLFSSFNRRPCFSEQIYAWANGPTVVEVYDEFKMFGSSWIPKIKKVIKTKPDVSYPFNFFYEDWKDPIEKYDAELIDDVVCHFKDYSYTSLINIPLNQTPWVDAWNRAREKGKYSEPISNDEIFRYFALIKE
jgi:uncharacterized phage-associated protein